MGLFGRAKEAKPVPTSADAILQMDKTLKLVEQRQSYLQHQIKQEETKLKKFVTEKNRREAILCIKKKKLCEQQISSLDGAIVTLTSQKQMLEGHSINLMVLDAMRIGAHAMKEETRKIGDVNGVEDVLANVEDSIADAVEINEAISQPISGMLTENDDDIEREYLELLEQEEDNGVMEEELPSVPKQSLISNKPAKVTAKTEEDEFAELEKDMGW